MSRRSIWVPIATVVLVAFLEYPMAARAGETPAGGAQLWTARSSGPAGEAAAAWLVVTNPEGSRVYVIGNIGYRVGFGTAAYESTTGALLWARMYRGPGELGAVA